MKSAERELSLSTGRLVDPQSPFVRLAELIADTTPGKPVIDLGVGEPKHGVPAFVATVMAAHINEFGRYPRNEGTPQFRHAVAEWAARRYKLGRVPDPNREVLVLSGSREGLFLGAIAARRHVSNRSGRPAILIPNPFYAAYSAGAVASDSDVVYLPAKRDTGFLPDLDALDGALLRRTVAMFLASPSNPQGAVADLTYLQRVTAMARRYGFLLFSDECYSEIYTQSAPPGVLEAAGDQFENVVLFQSLSKRSNLPGLRIGFVMGDRRFIAKFLELRGVAAPQVPIPSQEVAIAAYRDELHVDANRDLYRGNSISRMRSLEIALATGGRPAASSSGSMSLPWAAAKSLRQSCGGRRASGSCRAVMWHVTRMTAAIQARTIFASPWYMIKRPRRRHCTALSPCLGSLSIGRIYLARAVPYFAWKCAVWSFQGGHVIGRTKPLRRIVPVGRFSCRDPTPFARARRAGVVCRCRHRGGGACNLVGQ